MSSFFCFVAVGVAQASSLHFQTGQAGCLRYFQQQANSV